MADLFAPVQVLLRGQGTLSDVEQVLAEGANPDQWEGPLTPLRCAVHADHVALLELLLRSGANANNTDSKGVAALHMAVFDGKDECVKALLDGLADANIKDQHGQTPLFFAPTQRLCEVLIERRAHVNVKNSKHQSPLHLAAHAGLNEPVLCLVAKTLDAKDQKGHTPLHYAARSRVTSTATILTKIQGVTASQIVAQSGNTNQSSPDLGEKNRDISSNDLGLTCVEDVVTTIPMEPPAVHQKNAEVQIFAKEVCDKVVDALTGIQEENAAKATQQAPTSPEQRPVPSAVRKKHTEINPNGRDLTPGEDVAKAIQVEPPAVHQKSAEDQMVAPEVGDKVCPAHWQPQDLDKEYNGTWMAVQDTDPELPIVDSQRISIQMGALDTQEEDDAKAIQLAPTSSEHEPAPPVVEKRHTEINPNDSDLTREEDVAKAIPVEPPSVHRGAEVQIAPAQEMGNLDSQDLDKEHKGILTAVQDTKRELPCVDSLHTATQMDALTGTQEEDAAKAIQHAPISSEQEPVSGEQGCHGDRIKTEIHDSCAFWEVDLQKESMQDKFGFVQSPLRGLGVLIVRRVHAGGLLAQWNSRHTEAEVLPKDCIRSINGKTAIEGMQQEIHSKRIRLMMMRFPEIPESFTIALKKGNRRLGFRFERPRQAGFKEVRISEVLSDGALPEFNTQQASLGRWQYVVLPDMKIVAVNDVDCDAHGITEELKRSDEVTLHIRRK